MAFDRLRDILGFEPFTDDSLATPVPTPVLAAGGHEQLDPPQSRAAAALYFGSFLTVLILVVVANLLGDGTKLLPSPGFPSNCDRAWKSRRLEEMARSESPPTALIFGSSRVHGFEPDRVKQLTGRRCFNFGVSVGCPIDYLAMLRLAENIGIRPGLVIVGIDEYALGENPESDHYELQLLTHFRLFRQAPFTEQARILARAFKTITIQSTKASLINLIRKSPAPEAGRQITEIYYDDGLRKAFVNQTEFPGHAERLASGIEDSVKFWMPFFDDPSKIEKLRPQPRRTNCLRELLRLAREHGIAVHVALLPVHPEFERRVFSSRFLEIRKELGALLHDLCTEFGADYRDFTSLASFGGDPNEFVDGVHLTNASARKMIDAMLGNPVPKRLDSSNQRTAL